MRQTLGLDFQRGFAGRRFLTQRILPAASHHLNINRRHLRFNFLIASKPQCHSAPLASRSKVQGQSSIVHDGQSLHNTEP